MGGPDKTWKSQAIKQSHTSSPKMYIPALRPKGSSLTTSITKHMSQALIASHRRGEFHAIVGNGGNPDFLMHNSQSQSAIPKVQNPCDV
jgi:hypothetical protein